MPTKYIKTGKPVGRPKTAAPKVKKARAGRTWSAELIEEIQAKFNAGMRSKEVADEMNMSSRYLTNSLNRMRAKGYVIITKVEGAVRALENKTTGGTYMAICKNGRFCYQVGSYKPADNKPKRTPRVARIAACPPPASIERKPVRPIVTRTNDGKKPTLYTDKNPAKVVVKSDAWKIENGYRYVWVTPAQGRPYRALRSPERLTT